jgi:hypothetical protein
VAIKDYLMFYLKNKSLNSDKNVMKMMILLLAKICKLSWFDHPELKNTVTEVTELFKVRYSFINNIPHYTCLDESRSHSYWTVHNRTDYY